MIPPEMFDEKEVLRAMKLLADSTFEVRVFGGSTIHRSNLSFGGFFTSAEALVKELKSEYIKIAGWETIAFSMQSVKPETVAKSKSPRNVLSSGDEHTFIKDDGMAAYNVGAIDIDSIKRDKEGNRCSGISATDEEKGKALDVGRRITQWFVQHGFRHPVVVDSGNGLHLHLLTCLGLSARPLIEQFLKLLHVRFCFAPGVKLEADGRAFADAEVDASMANPSRVIKVPGTVGCKGSNSPEMGRPWRMSRMLWPTATAHDEWVANPSKWCEGYRITSDPDSPLTYRWSLQDFEQAVKILDAEIRSLWKEHVKKPDECPKEVLDFYGIVRGKVEQKDAITARTAPSIQITARGPQSDDERKALVLKLAERFGPGKEKADGGGWCVELTSPPCLHDHQGSFPVVGFVSNGPFYYTCQHNACASAGWAGRGAWKKFRETADPNRNAYREVHKVRKQEIVNEKLREDSRIRVPLPSATTMTNDAGRMIAEKLRERNLCFCRGGSAVTIVETNIGAEIRQDKSNSFVHLMDSVAIGIDDAGEPQRIGPQMANQVKGSTGFLDALDEVSVVYNYSILAPDATSGKLEISTGYNKTLKCWIAGANKLPEVPWHEAVLAIRDILSGFGYATKNDEARAVANLLSSALISSGALGGSRAPLDVGIALGEQQGKGYRNKLTAGVYGGRSLYVINKTTEVGGLDEAVSRALLSGHALIAIDNVRGRVDSPKLESALTEDYLDCRTAYAEGKNVCASNRHYMLTSNKAEFTSDLSARSCFVRIHRDPGRWKTYAEGEILNHVRARWQYYLACVYAVILEWDRRGRPSDSVACKMHSYHVWAGVVSWICQELFAMQPPLIGNQVLQVEVSSPNLVWLRDLAIKVQRAGKLDIPLRAWQLLDLESDGEDPDDEMWEREVKQIGYRMRDLFKGGDVVEVDVFEIRRAEQKNPRGGTGKVYIFSSGGQGVAVPGKAETATSGHTESSTSGTYPLSDEVDDDVDDDSGKSSYSSSSSSSSTSLPVRTHVDDVDGPQAESSSTSLADGVFPGRGACARALQKMKDNPRPLVERPLPDNGFLDAGVEDTI